MEAALSAGSSVSMTFLQINSALFLAESPVNKILVSPLSKTNSKCPGVCPGTSKAVIPGMNSS